MKKTALLLLASTLWLTSFAQHRNKTYNSYIEKYHNIAEKQQKEHRIPASIILAQGLLESGAGKSQLAREANNHFGIKCSDWKGAKVYFDDDHKNECFRKYKNALQSYEDHSFFLSGRPRYSSLFELSPTDYKGWAKGLKKAGYATDPTYAHKLISIIEEYELHRFDLASKQVKEKKKRKEKREKKKKTKTTEKNKIKYPHKLEPQTDVVEKNLGSIIDFSIHNLMSVNGVEYVTAKLGDTYGSIADEFNIKTDKVLSYNEVAKDTPLKTGQRVFLERKKKKASKGFDSHTIQEGESLYSIAQYYAIQIVELYKMNNMPYTEKAEVGRILKLRPEKTSEKKKK